MSSIETCWRLLFCWPWFLLASSKRRWLDWSKFWLSWRMSPLSAASTVLPMTRETDWMSGLLALLLLPLLLRSWRSEALLPDWLVPDDVPLREVSEAAGRSVALLPGRSSA